MNDSSNDNSQRNRKNLMIAWGLGIFVIIMAGTAYFILQGLGGQT